MYFLENNINDVVFEACSYNFPHPPFNDGDNLYILDFSFPRDKMLDIKEKAGSVIVLDHHKTAQEACEGLDFCVFDMEKSGAGLTWGYFYPNKSMPKLIAHIQDRDLWKWQIEGSKEVHAVLETMEYDLMLWCNLLMHLEIEPEPVYEKGKLLVTQLDNEVATISNNSFGRTWHGHNVQWANTSLHWSDVGNHLLENYYCDFAVTFTIFNDKVMLSLRSRDDFDVSEIAKQYGGGGHKQAAGCKVSHEVFFNIIAGK